MKKFYYLFYFLIFGLFAPLTLVSATGMSSAAQSGIESGKKTEYEDPCQKAQKPTCPVTPGKFSAEDCLQPGDLVKKFPEIIAPIRKLFTKNLDTIRQDNQRHASANVCGNTRQIQNFSECKYSITNDLLTTCHSAIGEGMGISERVMNDQLSEIESRYDNLMKIMAAGYKQETDRSAAQKKEAFQKTAEERGNSFKGNILLPEMQELINCVQEWENRTKCLVPRPDQCPNCNR